MKKIFALSLLSVMLISELVFATGMNPRPDVTPGGVWVKFLFNLHRPKFNCERAFGICLLVTVGIENTTSYEKNLCPVNGQLNERNQLILQVSEEALMKYEQGTSLPYFKDKTMINIIDPYTLPESACKALGAASQLTIKPGSYPVSFENGFYIVVFQL